MKWVWAIGCCLMLGAATAIAGCGSAPQPTPAPPTQTPWIVVVTSTTAPGGIGACPTIVCPTQTPWIVVATPTARRAAASTTRQVPTRTPAAGQATSLPLTSYPAPALAEPPSRQQVAWQTVVLFKWTSAGSLAADEFYHLHLERRPSVVGQSWYGDYILTRDTHFRADETFLAPFHPPAAEGMGTVYWWVRVVRKIGVDQNGKPIGVDVSTSSEERTLLLEAKPDDF